MKKIFQDKDRDWNNYYNAIKDRPPREILIMAADMFEKENPVQMNADRFAIDLGSGTGIDTIELLNRGWKVFSSDKEQKAIDIITGKIKDEHKSRLTTAVAAFDELKLGKADLINAGMSLPFCNPEKFDQVWKNITEAVKPGGRFSGNFFGDKDDWTKFEDMTFHTKDEVRNMFEFFEIEYFHERDEDGESATGEKKHWHVFSVIARKNLIRIIL